MRPRGRRARRPATGRSGRWRCKSRKSTQRRRMASASRLPACPDEIGEMGLHRAAPMRPGLKMPAGRRWPSGARGCAPAGGASGVNTPALRLNVVRPRNKRMAGRRRSAAVASWPDRPAFSTSAMPVPHSMKFSPGRSSGTAVDGTAMRATAARRRRKTDRHGRARRARTPRRLTPSMHVHRRSACRRPPPPPARLEAQRQFTVGPGAGGRSGRACRPSG